MIMIMIMKVFTMMIPMGIIIPVTIIIHMETIISS